MTLVLFANTKGGSGKSTAALTLIGELLLHKARVVVLEGDPNGPIMKWARSRGTPVIETSVTKITTADQALAQIEAAVVNREPASSVETGQQGRVGEGNLVVVHDQEQDNIFEWIDGASSWAHFVIADPEGSPNEWLADIASQADLLIVPFAPSPIEADQVSRTIKTLSRSARRSGKELPYRILITRAAPGAVISRDEREIRKELTANNLPLLATTLFERPAYRAIFKSSSQLISEMDPKLIGGLAATQRNAAEFASEVLAILTKFKAAEAA